jgi:uncharacterized protein (TIGR02284 family)
MTEETVSELQDLLRGLNDSVNHHKEAAGRVADALIANNFREIAEERLELATSLGGMIALADEKPVEEGSWLGSLRSCWTSFRAGLNSGDPTVMLIEAERAEDKLVAQFKNVLPQIAGNPINDRLLGAFEVIKSGHDRVLAMRNMYQAA